MRPWECVLRARPVLEGEDELIAAVVRQASGRIDLPPLAIDRQSAAGHGGRYACEVVATGTSLHSSQASGAYVANAWSRFSNWISSGRRDAWARCDISVGLSENSMNSRGSLAFRNSQIRWPRASANWLSSRSVLTYSVSFCVGTRTRAAVRTFGIFTPLPRETPAAAF